MKASLQLRMSQQLALTPQLQQSIRLLQLSTLELNQEIEQALSANPLLERTDDPHEGGMRVAADGAILSPPASLDTQPANYPEEGGGGNGQDGTADGSAPGSANDTPDPPAGDGSSAEGGELDWGAPSKSGRDDDEAEPMGWAAATPSLGEHLREQLAATRAGPRDRALVELLIDAIDDNGYLDGSLEELLALTPAEAEVELDELRGALALLQSFDPSGIGARDLAECLGLQLRSPDLEVRVESIRSLALKLVGEHLPLLAARDFAKLRRILDCSEDDLKAVQQLIRGLNPRPGLGFGSSRPDYVVPDLFARKVKGRWIAQLNPEVMPRLRLNQAFASAVRRESGPDGRAAWSARLQEARWLIRNLAQRFDTILRVSQAIVERQHGFFTHGDIAMRPLVLREIADTVGLHESTISRVTANKYIATPFGVFELKRFFGSHVATDAGGAASSTAIRALIKQLVGAENPKDPLSDSRLSELLGEQGIVVARRTVAKYRELLQIPPVSMRRSL